MVLRELPRHRAANPPLHSPAAFARWTAFPMCRSGQARPSRLHTGLLSAALMRPRAPVRPRALMRPRAPCPGLLTGPGPYGVATAAWASVPAVSASGSAFGQGAICPLRPRAPLLAGLGAATQGAASRGWCLGLRVGLQDRRWRQRACGLLGLRLGCPDWSLPARGPRGHRAGPRVPHTQAPSEQVNKFPFCTLEWSGCRTARGAAHLCPHFPGEVLGLEYTQGHS